MTPHGQPCIPLDACRDHWRRVDQPGQSNTAGMGAHGLDCGIDGSA